jgi:hypothetical protein
MFVSDLFQATSVFKVLAPNRSIKINLQGGLVDAALLKFAYTPLPEGTFWPRREHPEKLEPAKRLNYWQELAISKNKKLWEGRILPRFAVLVEEIAGKIEYKDAIVIPWNDALRIVGVPPFGLPISGTLTGGHTNGVWNLASDPQLESRLDRSDDPVITVKIDTDNVDDLILDVLEHKTENVQTDAKYTGDKFSIDQETNHFIGDDGFCVPRNFEEFWERWPHYIRNWVKKRLHKYIVDEDVEDWEMELLLHMKYLPERSKWRLAGMQDVIQTFNPELQYGASEKRFRNYVNNCLANRFNTIMSKRNKNPICRPGNYSLSTQLDPENYEVVDDEYVHTNSSHLMHISHQEQTKHENRVFLREFATFLEKHDPQLVPVMEAIAATGTFNEAAQFLNCDEAAFNRARNRIRILRDAFMNNAEVPKQRKPYRTRRTSEAPVLEVSE